MLEMGHTVVGLDTGCAAVGPDICFEVPAGGCDKEILQALCLGSGMLLHVDMGHPNCLYWFPNDSCRPIRVVRRS